jgi:hypothetical protein
MQREDSTPADQPRPAGVPRAEFPSDLASNSTGATVPGMASIADFENILERCRVIIGEHEKAAVQIRSLPDSEVKREITDKFAESLASAKQSEKLAREAFGTRAGEVELTAFARNSKLAPTCSGEHYHGHAVVSIHRRNQSDAPVSKRELRTDVCQSRRRRALGVGRGAARIRQRIVLVRRGNMLALRAALREDGFSVPSGSAAERVMLAAVRCGYAEELPDDERWRGELIRARGRVKK